MQHVTLEDGSPSTKCFFFFHLTPLLKKINKVIFDCFQTPFT